MLRSNGTQPAVPFFGASQGLQAFPVRSPNGRLLTLEDSSGNPSVNTNVISRVTRMRTMPKASLIC